MLSKHKGVQRFINLLLLFFLLIGEEGEARSVLQEQSTALGLGMFGLLVQRCTELLRVTHAGKSYVVINRNSAYGLSGHLSHSGLLCTTDGGEEQEAMVRVSAFTQDLRELLPSIKVWSDWMLGHPDQWNPPPCSIESVYCLLLYCPLKESVHINSLVFSL